MSDANSSYKRWHKPDQSLKAKTSQGYYHPTNANKYIGDVSLIIYRSSWEMAFCRFCDHSPSVLSWSSEPIRVPYYDRVSKLEECKKHNLDPNCPANWVVKYYNPDFWFQLDTGTGYKQKIFVEIKPAHKLEKPVPPPKDAPLKEQRKFNIAAKEFIINEAKYIAMDAWAKKNGAKFYIFTEDTLKNVLGRFWNEKSMDTAWGNRQKYKKK